MAENVLTHDFKYPFLVPLGAVPPGGLAIEVFDQDGPEPARGELLGTIRVTRGDVADLLAGSSRVKTKSDDSVTRLELSATRYRKRPRESVKVSARKRVGHFSTALVAGELIEVRSSRASGLPTIVVGARLDRLAIGACTRVAVASSGAVAATFDDPAARGGRVEVLYRVGPNGGVLAASVFGLEPSFEACLRPLVRTWRFGAPKDADGNPAAEDVEAELLLDAR